MYHQPTLILLWLFCALLPNVIIAGNFPDSASGLAVISLSKLDDIALGSWISGDVIGVDELCVYSTVGRYSITASSFHAAAGEFRLLNSVGYIVYFVDWKDTSANYTNLNHGVALSGQIAGSAGEDCGGPTATNASIRIRIPAENMQKAMSGYYYDTLTLVLAPE